MLRDSETNENLKYLTVRKRKQEWNQLINTEYKRVSGV